MEAPGSNGCAPPAGACAVLRRAAAAQDRSAHLFLIDGSLAVLGVKVRSLEKSGSGGGGDSRLGSESGWGVGALVSRVWVMIDSAGGRPDGPRLAFTSPAVIAR
jgi:hypothetical protein